MITYVIAELEKVTTAQRMEAIRCIPNAPARTGGEAITLCGWVDVPYREETGGWAPTCPDCLAIVAYCRNDLPEVKT